MPSVMGLKQKVFLVAFGLLLSLAMLEAGLRIAGSVILIAQEHRNSLALRKKNTYRIICVGESTTQGHYPSFLQKALNRRNIGIAFSVIDKGVAGTNTSMILSQIEGYLKEYHPDMVVAMMGINDQGSHLPHEEITLSPAVRFVRQLRVYKLLRLLQLHVSARSDKKDPRSGTAQPSASAPVFDDDLKNKDSGECLAIARQYNLQGDLARAERAYKKALELDPGNDRPYVELAWFYHQQGSYIQAEALFRKAAEINPLNADAQLGMGWFCKLQGDSEGAQRFFSKAIKINPEHAGALRELSVLHWFKGEYDTAIDLLERARKQKPDNLDILNELAFSYRTKGDYAKAEKVYKQALRIDPSSARLFTELGFLYREQLRYRDMEELFKTALRHNPDKDWVYGALASLYEETGRKELARQYARRADLLRLQRARSDTVENYRSLKRILDRHGVRLVCVQYPMRNLASLKALFEDTSGLIFVDNEKSFKDAVARNGRDRYFLDMFGGDFGHCTDEGNTLLAENIARAIVTEVFQRKGD